jgi:serine/threonine protein kinase
LLKKIVAGLGIDHRDAKLMVRNTKQYSTRGLITEFITREMPNHPVLHRDPTHVWDISSFKKKNLISDGTPSQVYVLENESGQKVIQKRVKTGVDPNALVHEIKMIDALSCHDPHHLFIKRLITSCVDHEIPSLIMPKAQCNLSEFILNLGGFSPALKIPRRFSCVRGMFIKLMFIVNEMHERGYTNHDFKADNILIFGDTHPQISLVLTDLEHVVPKLTSITEEFFTFTNVSSVLGEIGTYPFLPIETRDLPYGLELDIEENHPVNSVNQIFCKLDEHLGGDSKCATTYCLDSEFLRPYYLESDTESDIDDSDEENSGMSIIYVQQKVSLSDEIKTELMNEINMFLQKKEYYLLGMTLYFVLFREYPFEKLEKEDARIHYIKEDQDYAYYVLFCHDTVLKHLESLPEESNLKPFFNVIVNLLNSDPYQRGPLEPLLMDFIEGTS